MSGCLYRAYWDAAATPPVPKIDVATGLPYVSMRGNCIAANAGGAGPVFGAFATPRLTR